MMEGLRNEIRMQLGDLFEGSLSLGRPVPNEVINAYMNHRLDKTIRIMGEFLGQNGRTLPSY